MPSPVLGEAMLDNVAGHLLHRECGKGSPPGIDPLPEAELLYLTGNLNDFLHTSDAEIQAVFLRRAESVRNDHQLLHVGRQFPPDTAGIEENDRGTAKAVENIGGIDAVQTDFRQEQRRKQYNEDKTVQNSKQPDQKPFI